MKPENIPVLRTAIFLTVSFGLFLSGTAFSQAFEIQWWTDLDAPSFGSAATADIDEDGFLEIVFGTYFSDETIHTLNAEDGRYEIAIGCYDSKLCVLNAENGRTAWIHTASWYMGAPSSIADFDNDHRLEIAFHAHNQMGVLNHDSSVLSTQTTTGGCFRGSAVADLNGDGVLDLAYGTSAGRLTARRGDNGSQLWTYNLQAHYGDTFNAKET